MSVWKGKREDVKQDDDAEINGKMSCIEELEGANLSLLHFCRDPRQKRWGSYYFKHFLLYLAQKILIDTKTN